MQKLNISNFDHSFFFSEIEKHFVSNESTAANLRSVPWSVGGFGSCEQGLFVEKIYMEGIQRFLDYCSRKASSLFVEKIYMEGI
jgi:hypothetical protein